MRKRVYTQNDVKKSIERFVGKDVSLRIHVGRNRFSTKEGVIECLYPSMFVLKSDCGTSVYSYSAVACKDVTIREIDSKA